MGWTPVVFSIIIYYQQQQQKYQLQINISSISESPFSYTSLPFFTSPESIDDTFGSIWYRICYDIKITHRLSLSMIQQHVSKDTTIIKPSSPRNNLPIIDLQIFLFLPLLLIYNLRFWFLSNASSYHSKSLATTSILILKPNNCLTYTNNSC